MRDQFQTDLRLIYAALGGDESAVPPSDVRDTLNWWMARINEAVTGEFVPKAPDDVFDDTNWRLQRIYEGLTGEAVSPPETVEKLEWWFQQIHEFYTGEGGVVPPDPVENLDELHWWLCLILEDIYNSGAVPWRFSLREGGLLLNGDNLPASFAVSADGELTVNDADLPSGYTGWRVINGRLYADEAA